MFHSSSSASYGGGPSSHTPAFCYSTAPPPSNHSLLGYFGGDGGGGGSSLPAFFAAGSPPSYYNHPCYLNRSSSSHSLSLHHQYNSIPDLPAPPQLFSSAPGATLSSSPPSSSGDLFELNFGSVRRVLSTGDLQEQGMNALLVSGESYSQEGGAPAGRVVRYSAEERKERIEKYRSKRNQRNFHKKITYACRKTLADSRPRVKGRFARNGEPEMEVEAEAEATESSYYESLVYNSNTSYDHVSHGASHGVGGNGEWWRQIQAALARDEDEEYVYDEEILASLADNFSDSLLS